MKLFTRSAALAAALVSVVVVIPFLPAAKPRPHDLTLEARIASSVESTIRIYYDLGAGYNESHATELPIARGDAPQPFRFPLPRDDYRSLRLDVTNGRAAVIFEGPLRIVAADGRVAHTIALRDLRPQHQIENLRATGGRLEVITAVDANDPQIVASFDPPLALGVTRRQLAAEFLWRAAGVFIGLSLLLLLCDRAPGLQARAARATRWLLERPRRAIALVSAAATIASAYPVVFLGASYVAPQWGTTLLYDAYPTLPEFESTIGVDGNGSDMGATIWQHVPYSFMQRRAIERGELPLWNRYTWAGTPLLAQGQSMFGDPVHGLVLLFDGASWAWDAKYLAAKWLFAFALGLLVLQVAPASLPAIDPRPGGNRRCLGSALLVSAAAPFIGFFLFRVNHPAIFSLCYAPWVLVCWVGLAQAAARRSTVLWSAGCLLANFTLLNSGTAKEAALLLLQMNVAGALVLLTRAGSWRVRLAKLAAAAWAGVLVLLITAPMWASFLKTLGHAWNGSGHRIANQIQPALLLGAFDELFFRHLSKNDIVFNPSLNFLLLLGVLYFVATLRLQLANRAAVVLALCALGSLAIAFGVVPPHWITQLPLLGNVGHIENCLLGGFIVHGSVLAAVGFDTARRRLPTPAGRGDLLIAGLLLATMVGAWIGFRQAAHRMVYGPGTTVSVVDYGRVIPVHPFIWGSLAALLLASVGLVFIARRALQGRALGPGGALVLVLCGGVLLWRQGLHGTSLGFDRFVLQPPARATFHGESSAVNFVRAAHAREPARVFGVLGHLTPAWNAVYGLETIHGPDALQPPHIRELIDASPAKWGNIWRLWLGPADTVRARAFFDALNVRFYFASPEHRAELASGLELVHSADLDVHESKTAWPRAFFTDRVDPYGSPAELVQKMIASEGRPFAAMPRDELANHPTLAVLPRDIARRTVSAATDYRVTENTTAFSVRANGPGLVVFHESWWPDDFRVEINGRDAPVLRVNHAFQGVLIDAAGEYRVKFSYWPGHFTRLLVLSAVGAGLAMLSLVVALRGRAAAAHESSSLAAMPAT